MAYLSQPRLLHVLRVFLTLEIGFQTKDISRRLYYGVGVGVGVGVGLGVAVGVGEGEGEGVGDEVV